jgi:hypothetical protein
VGKKQHSEPSPVFLLKRGKPMPRRFGLVPRADITDSIRRVAASARHDVSGKDHRIEERRGAMEIESGEGQRGVSLCCRGLGWRKAEMKDMIAEVTERMKQNERGYNAGL